MHIATFSGNKEGQAKFIIADGKVYISDLGPEAKILHYELARQDGIHDKVVQLRASDPSKVCAGLLLFYDGLLKFSPGSSGYKIPVTGTNAERHAVEAFSRIIAPGITLLLAQGHSYPQNARLVFD